MQAVSITPGANPGTRFSVSRERRLSAIINYQKQLEVSGVERVKVA